ncbi:MAG: cation transporter, partial [Bryobacteraceae bacterium]
MTAAVQLKCDLCGLECGRHPLTRRIGGDEHSFCCAGCLNVHAILLEYKQSLKLGLISNRREEAAPVEIPPGAEIREALFQVSGMWCTSCAWLIEHVLRKQHGIVSADVFFASDLVKVRYCPLFLPRERIPAAIAGLGYRARQYSGRSERDGSETRDLLLRIGVAAFLWLNVMSLSLVLYAGYFERISDSVAHVLPFVLLLLATGSV